MSNYMSTASLRDHKTYTISELAREFGITPRALRFYEDKDMLHPARDGMTRVYSKRDRARVTIIMRLKRLGLPLADIREILDLYGMEGGEHAQMRKTVEKLHKQVEEFKSQRDDIELALKQLDHGINFLQGHLDSSRPDTFDRESLKAYDSVARRQLNEI